MSNEIAIRQANDLIQRTASDLDAAYRIAEGLGRTSFVPQHFRGKPDDAMAAILYGQTINMDPLTALQNLYVIGGKPALYARPMVGIVLSQGHEVWTEVDTPERVVVCGRRKGSKNVERAEWTIERAKRAGYTNNKKYQSDPQAMLYARASGDVARKVAPDALLGMAYNVEELEINDLNSAPPQRAQSQRVPSRDGHVDAPAEPAATSMDSLAAAANTAPSYLDLEEFLARVNEASTVDALRAMWPMVADLAPEHRDDVKAIIQGRVQAIESDEAGQPTLDAEVVDSDGAA